MSVYEYTLKFNQLARYTPEMAGNMRARMRKFASDLLDDLVLECQGVMLNRDMDFARLSVHIQQVKEKKKKIAQSREKDRWKKKKNWGNAQYAVSAPAPRPPVDGRPHSFQTNHGSRAQDTQSQGSVAQHHRMFSRCKTCGKHHLGRCQLGSLVYYSSGQSGHFQRDCPSARRNIGGEKSQANSSTPPLPQKGATSAAGSSRNRLYALSNLQEVEALPDVVLNGVVCSWSPTMTCFDNREIPYSCLEILESKPNSHAKALTFKVHPPVIDTFLLETSPHLIEWSTAETKDVMDNFSVKIVTEKVFLLKTSTNQNIVVASSPSCNGSLSSWRVPPSVFGEDRYTYGY
ncbi:uncharacterized protein LOC124896592 [Capsicum annuum]|uniref:uncharacterized protein LOC124896592 n=1 Tax=Capsicum annuum TaxID=4072 RepID=UPI001FB058B9|nr:uncharacterized protein LOC124896592 [Capsicum annuum]